jgi:hypothetical protein
MEESHTAAISLLVFLGFALAALLLLVWFLG